MTRKDRPLHQIRHFLPTARDRPASSAHRISRHQIHGRSHSIPPPHSSYRYSPSPSRQACSCRRSHQSSDPSSSRVTKSHSILLTRRINIRLRLRLCLEGLLRRSRLHGRHVRVLGVIEALARLLLELGVDSRDRFQEVAVLRQGQRDALGPGLAPARSLERCAAFPPSSQEGTCRPSRSILGC